MPILLELRASTGAAPARIIRRSAATQTFAPACDPAVVELILGLKQEASAQAEALVEARAQTALAEQALGTARLAAAEALAAEKALTEAAERALTEARAVETGEVQALRQQLLQHGEDASAAQEAFECIQGGLVAAKLDLAILDRKHRNAVEAMVEFRERAAGLEQQLEEALDREEAATAIAAATSSDEEASCHTAADEGSFFRPRHASCCPPPPLSTGGSSAGGDHDPCSIMLSFGSVDGLSDREDSGTVATTSTSTSQGGQSTASLTEAPVLDVESEA